MRKGKNIWIKVGVVTALLSCAAGLAYGVWWQRSQQTRCQLTNQIKQVGPNESAMEAARNADTSNFDNILRF